MSRRLLITCHHLVRSIDRYRDVLAEKGIEPVVRAPAGQGWDARQMGDLLSDVDAAVIGDDVVGAVSFAAAESRLRLLIKWGTGVDTIDFAAARAAGVVVANTPGLLADEVADVAVGYLIMALRRLHEIDREVRAGRWYRPTGRTLSGCTVAVLGLGNVGRAVIERLQAFGCGIQGFDISEVAAGRARERGIDVRTTAEDALHNCEALVVCMSLSDASRRSVGARALGLLAPGCVVVNVSRGGILDEAALLANLDSGHVSVAALDVFDEEPPQPGHPLLAHPSVILGSHNASNTAEGVDRVNAKTIAMVVEWASAEGAPRDGRAAGDGHP